MQKDNEDKKDGTTTTNGAAIIENGSDGASASPAKAKQAGLELRNFPLLHLESSAEVLVTVPNAGDVKGGAGGRNMLKTIAHQHDSDWGAA